MVLDTLSLIGALLLLTIASNFEGWYTGYWGWEWVIGGVIIVACIWLESGLAITSRIISHKLGEVRMKSTGKPKLVKRSLKRKLSF